MKLIKMTDFVLQNYEKNDNYQNIADECLLYANFLKQPLTLGMFIPCDENGNVLEDPEFHEPNNENEIGDYDELRYQYQEAKSKVIFEGFVFTESQKFSVNNRVELSVSPYGLKNERLQLTKLQNGSYHTWFQLFTIEDLIQCNLDCSVSF